MIMMVMISSLVPFLKSQKFHDKNKNIRQLGTFKKLQGTTEQAEKLEAFATTYPAGSESETKSEAETDHKEEDDGDLIW